MLPVGSLVLWKDVRRRPEYFHAGRIDCVTKPGGADGDHHPVPGRILPEIVSHDIEKLFVMDSSMVSYG